MYRQWWMWRERAPAKSSGRVNVGVKRVEWRWEDKGGKEGSEMDGWTGWRQRDTCWSNSSKLIDGCVAAQFLKKVRSNYQQRFSVIEQQMLFCLYLHIYENRVVYLSQSIDFLGLTRLFKMGFFHPPILKGKYGKCKAYGSSFILQKDTLFFLASVVSSHAYSFVLCASVLRYLPLRFLPLSRWLSWWGYTVVRFPHKYIHTYTFSQFAFSNSLACFSDRGGEAEASRGNPCEHTGLKTLSPHLARSGLNPGLSHFNHPA